MSEISDTSTYPPV